MIVAIVSDMHKPHHMEFAWRRIVQSVQDSLDEMKPDILIDAGDAECDLRQELNLGAATLLTVKGNHDWYGRRFEHGHTQAVWDGGDFLALGCTLWTDFNGGDPETARLVQRCLADYRYIDGFDPNVCHNAHQSDREWLESYASEGPQPTVVVTHHAPSYRSVHPRFDKPGREGLLNYGFVSDMDGFVSKLAPKLWVHGHVHDPVHYTIGETVVVANPCGYPHERFGRGDYKPIYVGL